VKSSRPLAIKAILAWGVCLAAAPDVTARPVTMRLDQSARVHVQSVVAIPLGLLQETNDAWLDLGTGKILSAADKMKPSGPLIRGRINGKVFKPSSRVDFAEAAKEPDPKDQPGWIELQTGQIFSDTAGRAPQSPYLRGRITSKGLFVVYPTELRKWAGLSERSPSPAPERGSATGLAVLRSVEGEVREVSFRPTEISINRSIKWQQSDPARTRLTYNAKEPALLQMEFTVTSPTDVHADFIRTFEQLMQEGDNRRPPRCRFSWGTRFPVFDGVIESLNVKYARFAADGTPLSAVVNIQMKEADSLLNRREAGTP